MAKDSNLPAIASNFAIVASPDASTAVTEAYESLGIESFNLNRIGVPAGGATVFSFETLEGDETVKELDVIVAGIKGNEKVWWRDEYTGGGAPPDCSSHDGITGYGNNSKDPEAEPAQHQCSTCAWNQWESSRNGGPGKDCADIAMVVFFRKDSFLPDMMVIPPSSLKKLREYSMKLMQAGKNIRNVVTKLTLETAQSHSGIKYSQLKLAYVADLDEGARETMKSVGETIMQSFKSSPMNLQQDDVK